MFHYSTYAPRRNALQWLVMTKRKLKKLAISLVAAIAVILVGALQEKHPEFFQQTLGTQSPGTYQVLNVEDGDTITVDMNGRAEQIRLIGVDTPETRDPRKPVQCFGKAASDFNKNLIGNNTVRLESDPLSNNRDRYNRLLRYVYLPDGRLVQAEIIRQGYGFAYTGFPFTKSDKFVTYQKEAREHNRGLWSSCTPEINQYGGFNSNPE